MGWPTYNLSKLIWYMEECKWKNSICLEIIFASLACKPGCWSRGSKHMGIVSNISIIPPTGPDEISTGEGISWRSCCSAVKFFKSSIWHWSSWSKAAFFFNFATLAHGTQLYLERHSMLQKPLKYDIRRQTWLVVIDTEQSTSFPQDTGGGVNVGGSMPPKK